MIRTSGGVALVVRRATGVALTIYFVAWLARLHAHPLVPFGGDLGRSGTSLGKLLEMILIAALGAHALEGVTQYLLERAPVAARRAFLLAFALVCGALLGAVHSFWFSAGAAPP